MKAYGAEVILVSKEEDMEGARDLALSMSQNNEGHVLDQFSNKSNYLAHYETTGPEIWKQTNHSVTHFISAMGTTGTITGVSRYLKEKNENIEIIGVQPTEGSRIPGIRRWKKEYTPKIFKNAIVDKIIDIEPIRCRRLDDFTIYPDRNIRRNVCRRKHIYCKKNRSRIGELCDCDNSLR
jgi:cysteine synthase B